MPLFSWKTLGTVVIVILAITAIIFGLGAFGVLDFKPEPPPPKPQPQLTLAPAVSQTTSEADNKEKVRAIINIQSNDTCIVRLNDTDIVTTQPMKPVTVKNVQTKKGDVLTFVVDNKAGWGGLRVAVRRGDKLYRTGYDDFVITGDSKWSKISDLGSFDQAQKEWQPYERDVPVDLAESEWIWNEDDCTNCTSIFRLKL